MSTSRCARSTRSVRASFRQLPEAVPGAAISLAVFGFQMLGDALRDVLDPRLRGATGSISH